MRSIINNNLFRYNSSSTEGMNNLCTVIHKLKTGGFYRGEVFLNQRYLGSFKINYDAKIETPQLNLDASLFDPTSSANKQRRLTPLTMEVGMEGYIVFHVSGHQKDAYFTLKKLSEKKREDYFDSRKLSNGDMAVFRVIYPGEYLIKNTRGSQVLAVTVREEKEGKYPDPSKIQPLTVTLSEKGFETKKSEIYPLQAIIIKSEIDFSLSLEFQKPKKTDRSKKAEAK
jgi:hypothetical protein